MRLPLEERIELLEELWDSIAPEAAAYPLTDAQRREVDRRWVLRERNPDRGVSWEQAKEDILRDL